MEDSKRGFYLKYQVAHADGSPLSPGLVFVLRPDVVLMRDKIVLARHWETQDCTDIAQLLKWIIEHIETLDQQLVTTRDTSAKLAAELERICKMSTGQLGYEYEADWPTTRAILDKIGGGI